MTPTIDPSKLKVTELREELQARGLDTKGNKPVLVKRLKKALEEELNKDLPDTSIADTSTEDLDCSRTEESNKNEDVEPESEPESKSVSDQKDADLSSQENVEESTGLNENAEASENTNIETDETSVTEETSKPESDENKQEIKEDQEEKATHSENNDVEMKEDVSVDTQKGEKRKRSEDSSEQPQKKKVFKIIEDEPEIDSEKVLLSWYDSDLNLLVNKESFLSAKPIHEGLFGYAWAGARATHGISTGKVRYEVKLTEEMTWEDFTNQRRERQEKARERREKEKQKKLSLSKSDGKEKDKKTDEKEAKSEEKDTKTEEKDAKVEGEDTKEETEVKDDEKMEVSAETENNEVEKSVENNEENKTDTPEESKMDTGETTESSPTDDNKSKDVSEEGDGSKESQNGEKTENVEESEKAPAEPQQPILTHIFRTGWSVEKSTLQLGEDTYSYGYESTGKFVSNKEFNDFAVSYKLGDVVGAYLNITSDNVEMRFTVNGELQPEVKYIPRSDFPQENLVLFPHVLSRNFSFELNLGTKEEPWFPCPEGLEEYSFIQAVEDKIQGPVRPEKRNECEVIMMCGLPGSGKTHWVEEYLKTNTDKTITVLGTTNLLDRMTVHGQPLKTTYNGQWNALLEKLQKCLNRLGDIAAQRRRNYILDQTNVFSSAQHRKLRGFEGFKRRAVVVVVDDEELAKRQSSKGESVAGEEAQAYALIDMKANMTLPTQGALFDEVVYTDLNEEESKAKVSQYNTEGKTALSQRRKYRDDKGRFYNRGPYNRGNNFRDRGPQRFDRGPRGWAPPPGRNPRDRRPPPPHVRDGGRDWLRNNRGPPRPANDRNVRDSRPPMGYNRNRNQAGGRPNNWQAGGNGYGQGGWGGNQGNWGANQGWVSGGYQGNWNGNQNQWKYGATNNQGYNQQAYGQNWNNYYEQYPQNWSGQGQQSVGSSNQYAQWAQYAQQYAQGQNAKYTNAPPKK